jgi:hypothetical protein
MTDETTVSDTMPLFTEAADAAGEPETLVSATAEEMNLDPDDNAPYGYMIDPATGDRRAKKRPGRQRRTPAAPTGTRSPIDFDTKIDRGEDQAPGTNRNRKSGKAKAPKPDTPAPPFRAGPIASGMNKLYARVGKVVRVWDSDIGNALVSITRKESDDDTTVGEAWEEIARSNPRIRAFLLRMLEGSAWSSLFMAHAPVFLALAMKDSIRKRLPFNGLIGAFLDTDDDGPSEVSEMLGGIQSGDVADMSNLMNNVMSSVFANMNLPRSAVINPQTTVEPVEGPWDVGSVEGETA